MHLILTYLVMSVSERSGIGPEDSLCERNCMASRRLPVLALVLLANLALPSLASAQQDCDAVLIPDVRLESMSRSQRLAWLKLVSWTEFKEKTQNLTTAGQYYAISGSLDANSFEQWKADYLEQQQYDYDDAETRSVFHSGLTKDQAQSWLLCKVADKPGVYGVLRNFSETDRKATLQVLYQSAPSRKAKIVVTADGATFGGKATSKSFTLSHRATKNVVITRAGRERGIVAINAYNGGDQESSADVVFPAPVPPPVAGPIPPVEFSCANPTNLARAAMATASRFAGSAGNAIDGGPANWNALAYTWDLGPRAIWLKLTLPAPSLVTAIKIDPEQNYLARHITQVDAFYSGGSQRPIAVFDDSGRSGDVAEKSVDRGAGLNITEVKVLAIQWDGSVSFREIEVWGCRLP